MFSYTNTDGIKFGIPNLIQQLDITVLNIKSKHISAKSFLEVIHIYQKHPHYAKKIESRG